MIDLSNIAAFFTDPTTPQLIMQAALSGAVVRELDWYDKHQNQFSRIAQYLWERWDNISISIISTYWLVKGAPFFWEFVTNKNWHNILTAFVIGLSAYSIARFILDKIVPSLNTGYTLAIKWVKERIFNQKDQTPDNHAS